MPNQQNQPQEIAEGVVLEFIADNKHFKEGDKVYVYEVYPTYYRCISLPIPHFTTVDKPKYYKVPKGFQNVTISGLMDLPEWFIEEN